MQLLGGQAWEAIFQVETHLVSEHAQRSGSGAVFFLCSFGKDSVKQV
jgi:hypothetical protein